MKKWPALLLTCLSFGSLAALPLGNPTEASLYTEGVWLKAGESCNPCDPCFSWCDAWSFRLGFYGDYVFNRHLHVDGRGDIYDTERFTNAGILIVNICNRLDFFTTLGATNLFFRADGEAFPFTGSVQEIRLFFKPEFSWSVGGRATLWECGAFGIGIEGEYFRTRPSIDRLIDMETALTLHIEGARTTYTEWQVGGGASYEFSTACATVGIVPYMGVMWSGAHLDMRDLEVLIFGRDIILTDLIQKKRWAYAVGATFLLRDSMGVTVEGRFAGEKAIHVNGQLRF